VASPWPNSVHLPPAPRHPREQLQRPQFDPADLGLPLPLIRSRTEQRDRLPAMAPIEEEIAVDRQPPIRSATGSPEDGAEGAPASSETCRKANSARRTSSDLLNRRCRALAVSNPTQDQLQYLWPEGIPTVVIDRLGRPAPPAASATPQPPPDHPDPIQAPPHPPRRPARAAHPPA
jgi:hypothetical protein